MAKKKKLRQLIHEKSASETKKKDEAVKPSHNPERESQKEQSKHLTPAMKSHATKIAPMQNKQGVTEKNGQSATPKQPQEDRNSPQLKMKKKPTKLSHEAKHESKASFNLYKQKRIKDTRLIPRMREYLDSRTKKNIVSIPLMAEYLQNKYPEYSRRKRSVFTMYIDRAYTIMDKHPMMIASPSSSDDDDDADGNDQACDGKPRMKKRKVLNYDDETDSLVEEEVLMEYKDTNSINNMMSNMYKSSPQHAAENPPPDWTNEPSKDPPSPYSGNKNTKPPGPKDPQKNSTDCFFIDKKGDDKKGDNSGKAKSVPPAGAANTTREATIQKFMGGLPVRTPSSASSNTPQDPRLTSRRLHVGANNDNDSDRHTRGHGGITRNNTGTSVEAPSSPTLEDQYGDRLTAPIVIASDGEDSSLMESNSVRDDIDNAVMEKDASTPKRNRKQKVASKLRKKKDEKPEIEKEKGPALQKSTVTFADIGGNEQSLIEICKLLVHMRHPEVYTQLGITPPRGFLLHGPPGCGKTLLANAIAGELDLPMIKIAATEIVSGVSGDSEEKVRELFEKATLSAPCVLFIDEVDAITPKRETASKDMERRIVSQLLTCMDDLNANVEAHVLVIGATNRPDSLDPALRRAGRFDKEVCMGIPDEASRKRILEVLCRSLKLTPEFDFSYLAKFTPGYVGADLMSLTREAAMVAVNRVFKDLQLPDVTNQAALMDCSNKTVQNGASCDNQIAMDTSNNVDTSDVSTLSKPKDDITDSDNVKSVVNQSQNDTESSAVNQSDIQTSVKQSDMETSSVNQSNMEKSTVNQSDSFTLNEGEKIQVTSSHSANTTDSVGNSEPVVDPSIVGVGQLDKPECDSLTPIDTVGNGAVNSCVSIAGNSTGIQSVVERREKNKGEHPDIKELESVLSWLKDTPPLTEDQLRDLFVNLEDFKIALKSVQPSAKREGFATVPDVTWEDIGALHDVREELQLAILAPVRHPEEFKALGLNRAQGILLAGPPGCGKTLLAKAVANESGINFISVKGPELLNMYVGESEKAVRTVFQRARNSSPCVIFFDELDALCPRRSGGADGGSSTRVVNQLLTEMDGLEERKQVFIMAATNRPDIIDPAVLRPGRLDKTLYVGLPTLTDRFDILKCLTKNGTQPQLSRDVDMNVIAGDQRCENYTGADIAALVREASVTALKEAISKAGRPSGALIEVNSAHFETAFRKIKPSVSERDRDRYMNMGKKLTTD